MPRTALSGTTSSIWKAWKSLSCDKNGTGLAINFPMDNDAPTQTDISSRLQAVLLEPRQTALQQAVSKLRRGATMTAPTVMQVCRHINFLELQAVLLVYQHFKPLLQGKHVMVRIDNRTKVTYITRQDRQSVQSC